MAFNAKRMDCFYLKKKCFVLKIKDFCLFWRIWSDIWLFEIWKFGNLIFEIWSDICVTCNKLFELVFSFIAKTDN